MSQAGSNIDLILRFPNLASEGFTPTSCATPDYNCIAWAAEDKSNWWWPFGVAPSTGKDTFWPRSAPNKETIKAFIRAFEAKRYRIVPDGNDALEVGFEKIAIYALGVDPTHAARQLPTGQWTHKLGAEIDLTASLKAIEGDEYGRVVRIMKRRVLQ